MNMNVYNETGTNIILSIDGADYLIKSSDRNLSVNVTDKPHKLSVKRERKLPAPDYKKMRWQEILGVFALLFIKPIYYILDVSSTYDLDIIEDNLTIKVTQKEKNSNSEAVYDVIAVECAETAIKKADHNVENKTEVLYVFERCQKVSHFWLYFLLVAFCFVFAMVTIFPALLFFYLASKLFVIKILLFVFPFLWIGFVMLIGVLPLHFLFKYQNRHFYRSFESGEVYSCLHES